MYFEKYGLVIMVPLIGCGYIPPPWPNGIPNTFHNERFYSIQKSSTTNCSFASVLRLLRSSGVHGPSIIGAGGDDLYRLDSTSHAHNWSWDCVLVAIVGDTSLQRNQCMHASATCNGFLFDGGGRRRGWGLDRRGAVSGGALQLNALNIVNALQTSE